MLKVVIRDTDDKDHDFGEYAPSEIIAMIDLIKSGDVVLNSGKDEEDAVYHAHWLKCDERAFYISLDAKE